MLIEVSGMPTQAWAWHPTPILTFDRALHCLQGHASRSLAVVPRQRQDPFADGRAALKLARETHRRVLIEVGGDWCRWCHVLNKFLAENKNISEQLHRHFVILKVNVSEANDNADFMAGFPRPLGYPHIYITESDGTIIFSKDTAELLENSRYSVKRFQQFIDKWKLP
jgi:thiol:disulfide interchange protein